MKDKRTHYKIRAVVEVKIGDDNYNKKELAVAERCIAGRIELDMLSFRARKVTQSVVDELDGYIKDHIAYLQEQEAILQAKIDNKESC